MIYAGKVELIILDFLGIVLIGIIFDELVRILFLSILFIYLQRYVGNYHAKMRIGCDFGSMCIVIINLMCIADIIRR